MGRAGAVAAHPPLQRGRSFQFQLLSALYEELYPLIVASILVAEPLAAVAQTTIKGVVTGGPGNERLPGVSIVVKGTTRGTTSNSDGTYALALPTPDATLIFSFIGYQTTERKVSGQATLDVSLEEQKALDEVVVVGYGTIKKSDLTGAVATVKTEDLLKTIPTSINQGLQGQVAGMQVNRSDGGRQNPALTLRQHPLREHLRAVYPARKVEISPGPHCPAEQPYGQRPQPDAATALPHCRATPD